MATDRGPSPSWPRPAGQGFGSFNRSTTRASPHARRAGPALGTTLRGASPPSSPSRFRTLNSSSSPIPVIGRRGSGGLRGGLRSFATKARGDIRPGNASRLRAFTPHIRLSDRHAGSLVTLRWRGLDSNFRFREKDGRFGYHSRSCARLRSIKRGRSFPVSKPPVAVLGDYLCLRGDNGGRPARSGRGE